MSRIRSVSSAFTGAARQRQRQRQQPDQPRGRGSPLERRPTVDAVGGERAERREPHERPGAADRAVDRRPERLREQPPRAIGARAMQELVGDVPERDDVLRDHRRVHLRDRVLAAQEEAVEADARDPSRLDGLEDHQDRQPVGDPADDRPAHQQHPGRAEHGGEDRDRNAEDEAEDRAEVDHQPQLAISDRPEDAVRELRLALELADHHELDVEQVVDVLTDHVREVVDQLRVLALDALVDGLSHLRREVAPEGRVLALHDAVDELAHVARQHDVLGDPIWVERLVEVADAT